MQLCTKDLSARLGNLRGGGEDVKKHPFFKDIDWEELEKKTSPGPIVPDLETPEDTKYFDQYPPQDQTSPMKRKIWNQRYRGIRQRQSKWIQKYQFCVRFCCKIVGACVSTSEGRGPTVIKFQMRPVEVVLLTTRTMYENRGLHM
ncbi:hypothetical protein BDZ91DRAFT_768477 [Kalaharituber pfeilii]|nr:hypothetical protein BDZ91DRAFT_768477 [Kalaharituber pfeilii]